MICLTNSYAAWIDDCTVRYKKGQRQMYWSQCGGLWRWPDECEHDGRLTKKEFTAMVRQVEREYPSDISESRYRKALGGE